MKKKITSFDKEGQSLWAAFTKGIHPYAHKKHPVSQETVSPLKKKSKGSTLVLQKIPVQTATDKPVLLLPQPSIEKTTLKKLRKGTLSIQARIDFHGMREHEAHTCFNHFIRQCAHEQKKYLLVVTGKGKSLHSEGVLRKSLPQWIELPDIREYILSYSHASPKDGGSGAWYIILRKRHF